jgi:hypothetical protein
MGAHIHTGWAASNGGIVQDLGTPTSPISGAGTVSAAFAQTIATGHTYVNVHTTAFSDGELRGQILKPGRLLYTALLSGDDELPPVVGADAGSLGVIVDLTTQTAVYEGRWPNTAATDAGIYQGGALATGAVVAPLTLSSTGAAGSFGFAALTMGDGGFYVNVNTAANPAGEIRGQLTQKP